MRNVFTARVCSCAVALAAVVLLNAATGYTQEPKKAADTDTKNAEGSEMKKADESNAPKPKETQIALTNYTPKVLPGINQLLTDDFGLIKGKKIGLITNPSGILADGRQNIDALAAKPGVDLIALFGPEHGVRGQFYGGDQVDSGTDPLTGITVHSLYGETHIPKQEWLEPLDALVYDIQDTTNRSYTFYATMAKAMGAAKEAGVPFIVCDRPTPMNGNLVDGNILDPSQGTSFVGLYPIAYIYGMTPGEAASYFNKEFDIGCDLKVVKMKGWRRSMNFGETGLMWVPPSQHVPRWESALFLAITGTYGELHTLNEGVGYTLPFEMTGAPFIDPLEFANALNALHYPGVYFRPTVYKPRYGTYEGELCGGVQIHVLDESKVKPVSLSIHIMEVAQRLYSEHNPLGNESDEKLARRINMFNKVMGTNQVRKDLVAGKRAEEIIGSWQPEMNKFMKTREKYLLYK